MQNGVTSVNLEDDEDLELVEAKDIVLKRFLGDGGFGTVREGSLHHTRVAVKIIKTQGKVFLGGAINGAINASLQRLSTTGSSTHNMSPDIRRDLARVCTTSVVRFKIN